MSGEPLAGRMPRGLRNTRTWYRGVDPMSQVDPALVAFMNTSRYRGRVIWGSDEPWFPMDRSLREAQALPLDDEAMALFLGGTARRLLDRTAS